MSEKAFAYRFWRMVGANVIHLYVSASGSAISSANLATAEDNLFNLDRRGDQQGALPPVQSANARAVDEPHILMRAFERY